MRKADELEKAGAMLDGRILWREDESKDRSARDR